MVGSLSNRLKSPPLNNLEDHMTRISGRPALNAVVYHRKGHGCFNQEVSVTNLSTKRENNADIHCISNRKNDHLASPLSTDCADFKKPNLYEARNFTRCTALNIPRQDAGR